MVEVPVEVIVPRWTQKIVEVPVVREINEEVHVLYTVTREVHSMGLVRWSSHNTSQEMMTTDK